MSFAMATERSKHDTDLSILPMRNPRNLPNFNQPIQEQCLICMQIDFFFINLQVVNFTSTWWATKQSMFRIEHQSRLIHVLCQACRLWMSHHQIQSQVWRKTLFPRAPTIRRLNIHWIRHTMTQQRINLLHHPFHHEFTNGHKITSLSHAYDNRRNYAMYQTLSYQLCVFHCFDYFENRFPAGCFWAIFQTVLTSFTHP